MKMITMCFVFLFALINSLHSIYLSWALIDFEPVLTFHAVSFCKKVFAKFDLKKEMLTYYQKKIQ